MGPTGRLALPRGGFARQFTKLLLSLLSHAGIKPQRCTLGLKTLPNTGEIAWFYLHLLTNPNFSPLSGAGSRSLSSRRAASRKIIR